MSWLRLAIHKHPHVSRRCTTKHPKLLCTLGGASTVSIRRQQPNSANKNAPSNHFIPHSTPCWRHNSWRASLQTYRHVLCHRCDVQQQWNNHQRLRHQHKCEKSVMYLITKHTYMALAVVSPSTKVAPFDSPHVQRLCPHTQAQTANTARLKLALDCHHTTLNVERPDIRPIKIVLLIVYIPPHIHRSSSSSDARMWTLSCQMSRRYMYQCTIWFMWWLDKGWWWNKPTNTVALCNHRHPNFILPVALVLNALGAFDVALHVHYVWYGLSYDTNGVMVGAQLPTITSLNYQLHSKHPTQGTSTRHSDSPSRPLLPTSQA